MQKKIALLLSVIILGMTFFGCVEKYINPEEKFEIKRNQQHLKCMEEGANPQLGITTIPDDFIVDDSFTSHLPLIIIDIGDKTIPITKTFTQTINSNGIKELGVVNSGEDPFVTGSISVIDNENHINSLNHQPTSSLYMKIRYRGNTSMSYAKKQYAIKLLNEDGSNRKASMLSMKENNDWILNGSMQDASFMRNYLAYNLGSEMFEYTTEAKYCEVLIKKGDTYKYQGLYLMMEKVEQGNGRVDIPDYTPGDDLVSYLLCRDRANDNNAMLSTYCFENELCYGRLNVVYPEDDILDEYAFNYIENDIDSIEKMLYSDNYEEFSMWSHYLDKQSFVDYFLFNEWLGNYDAGDNSTYYYKSQNGLLYVGPLWDYDGAMDNYWSAASDVESFVFQKQPWFERLCLSSEYVSALQLRYEELSDTLFSAEYIDEYIDDVDLFLGNAALREWSRWQSVYGENGYMEEDFDSHGYPLDRFSKVHDDEVQRLKDYFYLKEEFMEDNLILLQDDVINNTVRENVFYVILLIIGLISSIILARRWKLYR